MVEMTLKFTNLRLLSNPLGANKLTVIVLAVSVCIQTIGCGHLPIV